MPDQDLDGIVLVMGEHCAEGDHWKCQGSWADGVTFAVCIDPCHDAEERVQ